MSDFSYNLSVTIYDKKRLARLKKRASKHNRLGKIGPWARDILFDFDDGQLVRIVPSHTPRRPHAKRRIE